MASRLLSLFRILTPRFILDRPISWKYVALCRPWWRDTVTTEGTRLQLPDTWNGRANNDTNNNRNDWMMPVVNRNPIQSNNAKTMRDKTLLQWRRMMMQHPLTTTIPTIVHTPQTDQEPSQRRIPTTNQSQYGSSSFTGGQYHLAGGNECMAQ